MMGLRRRGAMGERDARTQGARVSAVIRARLRTRQRAAQRGPAAQRFIVKGVLKQEGFGLIELLISMVMLNVAILALVAAFGSGAFALQRAGKLSTAAAVADIQMERYRALKYDSIALDTTAVGAVPGGDVYRTDAAYATSQVTTTCTTPLPDECAPTRELAGPDGKRYRIDTYIVNDSVPTSRMMKRVTIVVRDANAMTGRALARVASTFDASTGS
jgi:Tfp pilus assembly protein PilE